MNEQLAKQIIQHALNEDVGTGDITSNTILADDLQMNGRFLAKADGIVAGLQVAGWVFAQVDASVQFMPCVPDGSPVKVGDVVAEVQGNGRSLLTAERTALNFMQRMSGIATFTRQMMSAVQPYKAIILDTRKTVPVLRPFDKWAVTLGGGQNHRIGLYDMALIKENHIAAVGGNLAEAVSRVRASSTVPIEIEVTNLQQLQVALTLPVDRIMLDNMSLDDMREAVRLTNGRIPLEASGNVALETVHAIASTGVDYISSGALTHSVQALDISLLLTQ